MTEMGKEALELIAQRAPLARPARADDATEDILRLGQDFGYLVIGEDGTLHKTVSTTNDRMPVEIVVDADSFLEGLTQASRPDSGELNLLAVHLTTGQVLKVKVPGLHKDH